MIYTDDSHMEKFIIAREKLHEHQKKDVYYLSALYIITSTEELYGKISPYFDKDSGFHAEEMFAKVDFSSTNLVLAKLAAHLFNNNYQVTALDLVELGEESYNIAMSAIYIRKFGVQ